MTELLKKFWFVIVVGFALIGTFVYVVYDENKDNVKGKTHNGQDVVFTIGDEIITAEMIYENISKDHQEEINDLLYYKFQVATINQSVPVTKEMRQEAKKAIEERVVYYFQYNYGESYTYYLNDWMASYGFKTQDDIINYTLPWFVIQPKMMENHFRDNIDDFFPKYAEELSPRMISHILVMMEDPENPTEEEMAKVYAIEEALKTQDFGEVATQYSDDTGSAAENGSIGLVDKQNQSNFVSEFSEVAMELADGQVSSWVATTYGWHIIKNMGSTYESLDEEQLFANLTSYYFSMTQKLIYDKAQELGVDFFGNDQLHKHILDAMAEGDEEE